MAKKYTIYFLITIGFLLLSGKIVLATTIGDSAQVDFDSGSYSGVAWNSTQINLDATGTLNGVGTYISSIKTKTVSTTWKGLGWTAPAPYGKPLPSSAGIETAYTTGNIDMTGNVFHNFK